MKEKIALSWLPGGEQHEAWEQERSHVKPHQGSGGHGPRYAAGRDDRCGAVPLVFREGDRAEVRDCDFPQLVVVAVAGFPEPALLVVVVLAEGAFGIPSGFSTVWIFSGSRIRSS